jgi:hypothetical protein
MKEERDVGARTLGAPTEWKIVGEFEAGLNRYPPIKVGTPAGANSADKELTITNFRTWP